MTDVASNSTPSEVLDRDDPGDETQRNFRYQHAYGVILLVGSACGTLTYVSIWCEHHEDLLAERADGLFDAYQIKTAKPENGPWKWSDDALKDSIKRFVRLNNRFPGKIASFSFVSNVECLDSKAKDKAAASPFRLLEAVAKATSAKDLTEEMATAFEKLRKHCGCTDDELLAVLLKLRLVKGPGRDSFDAEIAHDHLPHLPDCKSLTPSALNRLRDGLVQRVFGASSLQNDDPSRHWCCVNGEDGKHAHLRAKRIATADVTTMIREFRACPFPFAAGVGSLKLGGDGKLSVLERKMIRGGLEEYIESMRARALSAERHLMELAHLLPNEIDGILDQVAGLVGGECDEARLAASQDGEPYGKRMLLDVFNRLRDAATNRADMVRRQEYECLVGVAGLLTEDCRVWWSPKFELKEAV